jgi:hypothetical protein
VQGLSAPGLKVAVSGDEQDAADALMAARSAAGNRDKAAVARITATLGALRPTLEALTH